MAKNYSYSETRSFMTGDILWKIEDNALALGGVVELVNSFINENRHDDYTLSIFDTITSKTIEIECLVSEMPKIVDYIYHLEKGTPLTFIGVNSLSDCYVVGMSISRGRIDFGCYKVEDGKLKNLNKGVNNLCKSQKQK